MKRGDRAVSQFECRLFVGSGLSASGRDIKIADILRLAQTGRKLHGRFGVSDGEKQTFDEGRDGPPLSTEAGGNARRPHEQRQPDVLAYMGYPA